MATQIQSVPVEARATVGDTEFAVISIKVERDFNQNANYIKLEGIPESVIGIEYGDTIEAVVNDQTLLIANLYQAKQKEDGVVEIEGYGEMKMLQETMVSLNTEEPQYASDVIADLLQDAGYSVFRESSFPDYLIPGDAFVATKGSYVEGDTAGNRVYGNGKNGQSLSSVISDLSQKLGAIFWVDKHNRIRIEPYPTHKRFETRYVTELEAGDEEVEFSRVIVKGGSATTEEGQEAASQYVKDRITSGGSYTWSRGNFKSSPRNNSESNRRTIQDNNIISKPEADRTAVSEIQNQVYETESGTVTVIGTVEPELWDKADVPYFEKPVSVSSDTSLNQLTIEEISTDIASSPYTVKGITHMINNEDGFITELQLAPDATSGELSGAAGFVRDKLTRKINTNQTDRGVLSTVEGYE